MTSSHALASRHFMNILHECVCVDKGSWPRPGSRCKLTVYLPSSDLWLFLLPCKIQRVCFEWLLLAVICLWGRQNKLVHCNSLWLLGIINLKPWFQWPLVNSNGIYMWYLVIGHHKSLTEAKEEWSTLNIKYRLTLVEKLKPQQTLLLNVCSLELKGTVHP